MRVVAEYRGGGQSVILSGYDRPTLDYYEVMGLYYSVFFCTTVSQTPWREI